MAEYILFKGGKKMTENNMYSALLSRKFLFGCGLMVLTFFLTFMEKDAAQFVTSAGIIYATYVAGNVYQKKQ
jgi:hypothetical protein